MTEAEWLACDDPMPMLSFLWGKGSNRKFRLYTCATCRRIWSLLTDERSRAAVECAEQHADDKYAAYEELAAADAAADEARIGLTGVARAAADAALCATNFCEDEDADAAIAATKLAVRAASMGGLLSQERSNAIQARLLRCIYGFPLHPVTIHSSWITSGVTALSQDIYADRAFDRLPILADALQDAGCEDADILAHCRSDGPHVRGCWVVDLVLGKE